MQVIAITILAVLVVLLGSLEVVQLAIHTLFPTFPYGPTGSNQAGISPAQHTIVASQDNTCEDTDSRDDQREHDVDLRGCNDPVHTTINSITIDTTHLRLIWTITLNNQSGAQQIDYFAQFSLQDPLGNTYEGTGNLNTDFFLSAGQHDAKPRSFRFCRVRVSPTYSLPALAFQAWPMIRSNSRFRWHVGLLTNSLKGSNSSASSHRSLSCRGDCKILQVVNAEQAQKAIALISAALIRVRVLRNHKFTVFLSQVCSS